jgi:hypothetical protein
MNFMNKYIRSASTCVNSMNFSDSSPCSAVATYHFLRVRVSAMRMQVPYKYMTFIHNFWDWSAIWPKSNLGLQATITLKVGPFHAYAPFPVLMPFLECMQEVVFCEGVQHHLQFYLDHLNCAKMVAFQFYLQSQKQKICVGPNQVSRVGGL